MMPSRLEAMRTTLTLDPDVEQLVKQAMRDGDATLKKVVNDALRRGLSPQAGRAPKRFVQPTFDCGRALVDLTKASSLADELDDQVSIAKLLQRG